MKLRFSLPLVPSKMAHADRVTRFECPVMPLPFRLRSEGDSGVLRQITALDKPREKSSEG